MVAPSSNKEEEESVVATTPTNANASKAKAKSSSSKGKRRKLPKAVTNRSADETLAGGGGVKIAENQRSSNGSGKTAMEGEGDSKINKEAKALIELEKPRLWRSLEELRDRARDVEDKVASLAERAREEMDEIQKYRFGFVVVRVYQWLDDRYQHGQVLRVRVDSGRPTTGRRARLRTQTYISGSVVDGAGRGRERSGDPQAR